MGRLNDLLTLLSNSKNEYSAAMENKQRGVLKAVPPSTLK